MGERSACELWLCPGRERVDGALAASVEGTLRSEGWVAVDGTIGPEGLARQWWREFAPLDVLEGIGGWLDSIGLGYRLYQAAAAGARKPARLRWGSGSGGVGFEALWAEGEPGPVVPAVALYDAIRETVTREELVAWIRSLVGEREGIALRVYEEVPG